MGVPIALYSSPPSTVCSTYPCSDFDLNSRSSPVTVGGLSCLFGSSISMKHSSDDHGSLRQTTCFSTLDRAEELGSSFGYSSLGSSLKSRDQSPISVFHAPVSCSSVGSRSPSVRIPRDRVGETSFKSHRDGLFKSFVSNAFFPVDYDSRSISMLAASEVQEKISPLEVEEELPFSLEENFDDKLGELMDGRCNEGYAREILARAQDRHMIFHQDFVIRAFHEAERAHRGQMRANGDPYLQHCVETALLLAEIGANTTIVAAGLLHDTLDDAFVEYDYICKNFGSGVGDLVEGVSRLSHLSKLARENNTASRIVEADRLHTMFLAMVDARAVLIKLADRLHNMMTLDALPVAKQRSFAEETLQVFSPLANRLGISTWKEQLENLCLKHLHPVQHDELAAKLVKPLREATISAAIDKLGSALNTEDIQYHVLSGRRKSLYSIYSKMLKKKLTMDGVHDIHGLRLIVENENDCFAALDIVHSLWPQMPGKLKDYISHPKDNGYQSLHTVVMGEDMVPLEVQIRTKEMHLHAEFGIAAHWRYKEGNCMHPSCVLRIVEYARWVVTWQAAYSIPSLPGSDSIRPPSPFPSHSDDCPYASSMLYLPQDGPVFVIVLENEKMSVQEYPTNCSVADLLDKFGKDDSVYGVLVKKELRPQINGLPVSDLHRKLKMGDVVELTPAIPNESLTECREEIRRMFDRDLILSKKAVGSSSS